LAIGELAALAPHLLIRRPDGRVASDWQVTIDHCEQPPNPAGQAILLAADEPGSAHTQAGMTQVYNAVTGTHFHVRPAAHRLRICLDPDSERQRIEAVQVIRGLLLGLEAQRGAEFLHGAVLAIDGRGVLLLGAKGAGKTTFALSALQAGSSIALVSNDKSVLDGAGLAYGLPYAVAVAPGTLSRLPELQAVATRWSGGKAMLWPAQLAAAMAAQLARTVKLEQVWLTRLDLDADGVAVRPIPAAIDHSVVSTSLEFSNAMSPRWLYRLAGLPDPAIGVAGRNRLRLLDWVEVTGNPWRAWDPVEVARAGSDGGVR